jgi:hypothetical protein
MRRATHRKRKFQAESQAFRQQKTPDKAGVIEVFEDGV